MEEIMKLFLLFITIFLSFLNAQEYSLQFNGEQDPNNDYVEIPHNEIYNFGSGNFTIENWYKSDSTIGHFGNTIIKIGSENRYWDLLTNANNTGFPRFHIANGAGSDLDCLGDIRVDDNIWHHICGVRDRGNMYLYIDGELHGSLVIPADASGDNNGTIQLGARGVTVDFPVVNNIDETRVWNRALSQNEIQEKMFTKLIPDNEVGLVGYWNFNTGHGEVVYDITAYGNNGLIYGAKWSTDVPIDSSSDSSVFRIESIIDVPNDQGRQVRIKWNSHYNDSAENVEPIIKYSIWRKFDPNLILHKGNNSPEGEWDFITEVPATQDHSYSTIIPTLADSNEISGVYFSNFIIRAHTSDILNHWVTEVDSGFSLDNLRPHKVLGAIAEFDDDNAINLSWNQNDDPDIKSYLIYRSVDETFFPSSKEEAYNEVSNLNFKDEQLTFGTTYFYFISAVDNNGNEGIYSEQISMLINNIANKNIIFEYKLYPNFPNPFNPKTTIGFSIIKKDKVTIDIYNMMGQRLYNLVEEEMNAGYHQALFDGENLSSGVYIYSIQSGNFTEMKKMILLK
jgi:Concanavalin A-like lectin/glucanases superfamily/Secretion system C-terminal sorting domain